MIFGFLEAEVGSKNRSKIDPKTKCQKDPFLKPILPRFCSVLGGKLGPKIDQKSIQKMIKKSMRKRDRLGASWGRFGSEKPSKKKPGVNIGTGSALHQKPCATEGMQRHSKKTFRIQAETYFYLRQSLYYWFYWCSCSCCSCSARCSY